MHLLSVFNGLAIMVYFIQGWSYCAHIKSYEHIPSLYLFNFEYKVCHDKHAITVTVMSSRWLFNSGNITILLENQKLNRTMLVVTVNAASLICAARELWNTILIRDICFGSLLEAAQVSKTMKIVQCCILNFYDLDIKIKLWHKISK